MRQVGRAQQGPATSKSEEAGGEFESTNELKVLKNKEATATIDKMKWKATIKSNSAKPIPSAVFGDEMGLAECNLQ